MQQPAYTSNGMKQLELEDSIRLTLFGRVICDRDWKNEAHSHDFWELMYISKKETDSFAAQWDGGAHEGEKAAIYLFPPHCKHSFHNTGRFPAQNIYVGFTFTNTMHSEKDGKIPFVIPFSNAVSLQIQSICDDIAETAEGKTAEVLRERRFEMMHALLFLTRWLTEVLGKGHDEPDNINHIRIAQIKETIMNNLHHYISVEELAKQLYFSPNYLGQFFRQYTGMTVKSYHNKMRMEHALNLLISTSCSVGDIAEQLGFEGVAYFSRKFKDFYGVSPSRVMKRRNI